jgi:hypothetical protein
MFYDNFVRLCNTVDKSPSAVAEELGIYKSTVSHWKLGHAAENGEIEYNPAYNVKIPKNLKHTRREPATPEQETIIKKSADNWLFPYLFAKIFEIWTVAQK